MQLKSLGKIITLTQTLPLSISAVEAATSNLNEKGLKAILVHRELTGVELENALAAIKDAQAHGVLGSAVMMLQTKIASLVGTFKTLWVAMLANPATAVVAVVATATAAWVAYQAAHEKSLKSLKKSLEETQDHIKSVNDKIGENRDRINELNELKADGKITAAEEAELETLTKQTEQYEAQLKFLQAIEKHKTKEYNNKRLEEASEDYNEYTSYGEYGKDIETWNATRTTKGLGGMKNAVEDYHAALERLSETQKQIRDFSPDGTAQSEKEAERLEKQLEKDQAKVDAYFDALEGHYLELIALREKFDGLDSDEARAMVSTIDGWMQQIADITEVKTPFEKFQDNVKSLSSGVVNALASDNELTRMQKAEFEEWAKQVGYTKEDIKDLSIYFQRLLGLDASNPSQNDIRDRIMQARKELQNVKDEMSRLGVDANETIFGNIDANNRQILEWTDENIEKFREALASWGEDIDAIRGEYSTIMGTSSGYDGLEIAFTPILQTEHGPELLSADTVNRYIWSLLDEARGLHENGQWNTEDLLNLDARGIEIDGRKIRGIIADIGHTGEESGEKVRKIAEAMHFVGRNGELARVTKELDDAKAAAHDFIQNYIAKDIANLGSLRDELAQTGKAWEEYNKILEGGDRGDAAKQMSQAYQKAIEDIEKGRIDTKAVWGAAKLLFSDQQLADMKYDLTRIAQELSGPMMKALFSGGDDDTDIGVRFANYIKENAARLESAGAHILDQGNGKFQFWYDSLGKLAKSLGMSEEALSSLLDALDAYGVQSMQSGEDITELANKFYAIQSHAENAKDAVKELIQALASGENPLNEYEIIENLKTLRANGVITGDDKEFSDMIHEVLSTMHTVDKTEAAPTVKLNDQATNPAINLRNNLEALFASPLIQTVIVNEEQGTTVSSRTSSGSSHGKVQPGTRTPSAASAAGTKDAPGGVTLVNEKGPELISDNGVAYIANGGKPGFVNLGKGAVVFNAEQTEGIFSHGYTNIPVRAFADGTANTVNKASIRDRLIGGKSVRGAYSAVAVFRCSCGHSWNYDPISYPGGPTATCPSCGRRYEHGQLVGKSAANPEYVNNGYEYVYDTGGYQYNNDTGGYDARPGNKPTESYHKCVNCGHIVSESYQTCPVCGKDAWNKQQTNLTSKQDTDISKALAKAQADSAGSAGGSSGYTGGGGGSSVGSADYAEEAEPEKVDWIAVLLNRIQRKIADLEKVASSGFKSLSTRLKAGNDEVAEINKEIGLQRQAYDRYIQEANSVGLSDELAKKVQDGTIDINEYDQDTRELIDKYETWYITNATLYGNVY